METNQLNKFPFFTGKTLKAFLDKNHPEVTISRLKSKIITIEKGKYTVHTNPLIYATVLVTPSYCSFRSALSFYQLTNQIPTKTQVVIQKRKNDVKDIHFITTNYFFGFTRMQVEGFDFFIANKEKLLLDCLLYQKEGVMPSELSQLIKEPLDTKKVIRYLKRINNLALIKRTGYLLDLQGKNIYNSFKRPLEKSDNYPLLNTKLPKSKNNDIKWRLNINEKVEI